jgi:hypothetical protein
MSAEHTTKRPAPAMTGYAEPPRDYKRDEKRFLLMYFGRFNIYHKTCVSKRCGSRRVERWNQRLVSEESAFYTQIGVGCLDAGVDKESCDLLWSTTVRCN